jgi:hypothetical protein
MNEPNPTTPLAEKPTSDASDCLQAQINLLLVALIVLSGTFATYLYVRVRHAKQDLAALKQNVAPIFQAYNQETPQIGAWVGKLADFGRAHADFQPIMRKYPFFFPPSAPATTSAPPAAASKPATTPAAAPAPKK